MSYHHYITANQTVVLSSIFYLEAPGQELVLYLQEVALSLLAEEWLVDDLESVVILNVLPSSIAMSSPQLRIIWT